MLEKEKLEQEMNNAIKLDKTICTKCRRKWSYNRK